MSLTVNAFQNLSELEKAILYQSVEIELPKIYVIPAAACRAWIDIETYKLARFDARNAKPEIQWPKDLSKKELVLCKLNMIHLLFSEATSSSDESIKDIVNMFISFIADVKSDIYRHKSSIEAPKWAGLAPDVAELLNRLFKPLLKEYQKKICNII